MSAWRRLALELLPEHKLWIEDKHETFSIYQLFFGLLPIAKKAHAEKDIDQLERIYKYAEWCWKQKKKAAPDIHNAVGVAFYEHLVDEEIGRNEISHWIKPEIFFDIKILFKQRLSADVYQDLVKRYNLDNQTDFN